MVPDTNSFLIRKGTKQDLPSVLNLINELALFEKAPEQVINTVNDMEKDGFGKNPVFNFYVAELNNTIVGRCPRRTGT